MSIQSNFPNLKPSLLLDFANTKQLDNRITFTRSTPAVYYDGKTTAMAEQNLVSYSQQFENAYWFDKSRTTVTADTTTAPDGTSTADTIFETATTGGHWVGSDLLNVFIAGQTYTYSIYAKNISGGRGYINLSPYGPFASGSYAQFNLNTGAVGTTSGVTASIISVGNGWYRCIATATATATSTERFYVALSDGSSSQFPSYAGDVSKGIFVWGAQLEQRSTATAYTVTTSQPITNYIPVLLTAGGNQARFDCNPTTGESLGLLIEEQRTNIATYSEQFGSWNVSGSGVAAPSILANQVIAPDGTLTGDQITLPAVSGASNFSVIYFPFTASATAYTGSFYLKGRNGGEVVWINFTKNGITYTQTLCTLTTSWQRFSLTSTLTAGGDNFQIGVDLRDSAESAKPAQTFFIWGAQLEVGSFATSYIATTSASATRTADVTQMTGTNFSSWFNNAQGTTYVETSCIGSSSSGYFGVCKFNDGSIANRFGIYGRPSGAGYGAVMTTNGTTVAGLEPISGSTATIVNTYSKITYSYQVNNFSATRNASTVTTDTAGDVAVVNRFDIGLYDDVLNGYIKKLAYYPIAVTSANLQALTS